MQQRVVFLNKLCIDQVDQLSEFTRWAFRIALKKHGNLDFLGKKRSHELSYKISNGLINPITLQKYIPDFQNYFR